MIAQQHRISRWLLGFLVGAVLAGATIVFVPSLADECPDAWITAKVKSRLFARSGLGVFKINVDTDLCVVTLTGCVDTAARKAEAVKITMKVKKVRKVKNKLTLCESSD